MNATAKTITDIKGRRLNIPDKIEKIIAIGPGALRMVTYIGETDKICGVEKRESRLNQGMLRPYATVLKDKVKGLPIIGIGGSRKMPNLERVISLNPDVLIGVGYTDKEIELIVSKTRKPFIILSYGGLPELNEKFLTSMEILGKVFGKEERASKLIEFFKDVQEDLKERTKGITTPKRVYVGGIAYKGANDITSTTTLYYPFKLLFVNNVISEVKIKGHLFIDWEKLIIWNPEYIFVDSISLKKIKKAFLKNPQRYKMLSAYRDKKIFTVLPCNYYNINVELALINAYFIGKTIYPDRFKDLDFPKKSREIYRMFLSEAPVEDIATYYGRIAF